MFAFLSMVLATGPAAGQDCDNPLVDPGFEQDEGWTRFGGRYSDAAARSGERSLVLSVQNDVIGAYQEFPAAPGSRWRLTGHGMTPVRMTPPAFGVVQVTFFDAEGRDLGTVETKGQEFPAKTSNGVNMASPLGAWVPLDTGVVTAPPKTATIQAFALLVERADRLQAVYFDDLALCEVKGE